jgi:hypothetical protein
MIFIPKPVKAKAIYPINLPFFMLKMIKKNGEQAYQG